MPRWLRYSVLISATFASIALLGLMLSLSDPRLFDRYFPFLLVLNVMIAGILIVVVAAMIIRLTRSYRQKQFGSRMTARLACITAIISVIPTATVYILSSAVISRSTDTDLNSRVETALDAGVHITQGILARRQNDAEALARQFAQSLSSTPVALMMNDLLKLL